MIVSATLLRSVRELAQWAAGRRRRYRVSGDSMLPTLTDGEFVLVDRTVRPAPGDLALAAHPDGGAAVVKRLTAWLEDGRATVSSDNPLGTDSRTWGPLEPDAVEGRVTLVLDRPTASLARPAEQPDGGSDGPRPGWARWLRR